MTDQTSQTPADQTPAVPQPEPAAAPATPADQTQPAAETPATPATPAPTPEPAVPSNGKIVLVAEDDRFYAHIYEVKLAKLGYAVEVVKNGEELLESMKKANPDLILLDLMMPVKDGFDTLRDLKSAGALEKTKVIVISNLGQEEDIKAALDAGATDYFIKANVSIEEMVSKVQKHLS